jgi:hypothetical protein
MFLFLLDKLYTTYQLLARRIKLCYVYSSKLINNMFMIKFNFTNRVKIQGINMSDAQGESFNRDLLSSPEHVSLEKAHSKASKWEKTKSKWTNFRRPFLSDVELDSFKATLHKEIPGKVNPIHSALHSIKVLKNRFTKPGLNEANVAVEEFKQRDYTYYQYQSPELNLTNLPDYDVKKRLLDAVTGEDLYKSYLVNSSKMTPSQYNSHCHEILQELMQSSVQEVVQFLESNGVNPVWTSYIVEQELVDLNQDTPSDDFTARLELDLSKSVKQPKYGDTISMVTASKGVAVRSAEELSQLELSSIMTPVEKSPTEVKLEEYLANIISDKAFETDMVHSRLSKELSRFITTTSLQTIYALIKSLKLTNLTEAKTEAEFVENFDLLNWKKFFTTLFLQCQEKKAHTHFKHTLLELVDIYGACLTTSTEFDSLFEGINLTYGVRIEEISSMIADEKKAQAVIIKNSKFISTLK